MNAIANNGVFWVALITGLAVLYLSPVIIGLARHAEPIAVIITLTLFPLLWPAALLGAFMLPARHHPPAPARTRYRH